jgi:hypothetical protein
MVNRVVRADVAIRELRPAPPPRPISVAMAADYRSAAATAMVEVLREVSVEWVDTRQPLPALTV